MKKTIHQLPRHARPSRSLLKCSTVLVLSAASVVAQSRIIRPDSSNSSVAPGNRYVATLRAGDSPEGSRVRITSRQSLNNYEAYRRGDRFYVKIPAAEVPGAETLRGRGFSDVKVQRLGDSIVISFRLTPGGTAHVEQSGNTLEIVFAIPGARVSNAANTGGNARGSERAESNRGSNPVREGTKQSALKGSRTAKDLNSTARASSTSPLLNSKAPKVGSSRTSSPNSGSRSSESPASSDSGSKSVESLTSSGTAGSKSAEPKSSPASSESKQDGSLTKSNQPTSSSGTSETKAGTTPESSLVASATPGPSVSSSVQKGSSSAVSSPAVQPTSAVTRGDEANQVAPSLKERLRYWILYAQLNPIPVAIGLGLSLLIIALLFSQRRRAKGTRRRVAETSKPKQTEVPAAKPAAAKTESLGATTGAEAAAATAAVGAATLKESKPEPPADEARRDLVARVADEAKKATTGGEYDQNVIGSADRETRQLVGAELLAALVGRDAQRRERAREAFMKHGYFDDATRDLRVGESANQRAAAARRLSFVNDREATPHLVGALEDSSPDVRRAAVEALTDLRDPAAIPQLNALMRTENDPKVPRNLIKHAIDACATSAPEPAAPVGSIAPAAVSQPAPAAEREVIEI